jgi:SNF2 family DNA or RNA helicase
MTETFQYRTEPFAHQRQEFDEARHLAFRAMLWEQGTAKSKVIIDTGVALFLEGHIDAVVIVAPNGVDENWVTDQIPEHCALDGPWEPVSVASMGACAHYLVGRNRVQLYRPEKFETMWHQRELRQSIYHEGLLWLCVPYDLYISARGKKFIWEVLKKRKALYVLDEASSIKSPSAKRSISIIASGAYAPYRRILEGTPVSNSPFDIYSQVRFLDPDFWKRELEIGTAVEFRQYFGIWRPVDRGEGNNSPYDPGMLVGYKRLDQLNAILKKIGSRYLKSEVLKDIPDKLFSKRYFELNTEQKNVYKQLKEGYMADLPSGEVVTAPLAITQLLRLQQVTCGYVPVDSPDGDPQPVELLGKRNPRLELLEYLAQTTPHQALIWARFHKDLDLITELLGRKAVRYDGKVEASERQLNKEKFLRGEAQFMCANPAAMARGHTFINALTTIYYNNSFKLIDRLQSEDRNHRAGQKNAVNYIDIIAPGTVDTRIVANLRNKVDIASQVTGDQLKEWI